MSTKKGVSFKEVREPRKARRDEKAPYQKRPSLLQEITAPEAAGVRTVPRKKKGKKQRGGDEEATSSFSANPFFERKSGRCTSEHQR